MSDNDPSTWAPQIWQSSPEDATYEPMSMVDCGERININTGEVSYKPWPWQIEFLARLAKKEQR